MSLAEAASETHWIEQPEPFKVASEVGLSQALFQLDTARIMHAATTTAAVQCHTLQDVVLDVDSLSLSRQGALITETADPAMPAAGHAMPGPAASLPEGAGDIILGYTRNHTDYRVWLTQCLPAIDGCLRTLGDKPARLLLPQLEPWQEDFVKLLGYGGLPRVTPPAGGKLLLQRLLFADVLTGAHNQSVSLALRRTFDRILAVLPQVTGGNALLYVPSRDAGQGQLTNEAEVVIALRDYGVRVVEPTLSVAQRISLFRNAQVVIGPSGPGLTDIVFCRPRTLLWEWMPRQAFTPVYNRLAQAARVDYLGDVFPISAPQASGQNWHIEPEAIRQRMLQIGDRLRRQAAAVPPIQTVRPSPVLQAQLPILPPLNPLQAQAVSQPSLRQPTINPSAAAALQAQPASSVQAAPPASAASARLASAPVASARAVTASPIPTAPAAPAPSLSREPAEAPLAPMPPLQPMPLLDASLPDVSLSDASLRGTPSAGEASPTANPAEAAPAPQDTALFQQFEPLGEEPDFGAIQHQAGVETLSLLRFARFNGSAEERLAALAAAIDRGFEGVGQDNAVTVRREPGDDVPVIQESTYNFSYPVAAEVAQHDPAHLVQTEAARLAFLGVKLLDTLLSGARVCVWHSAETSTAAQLEPLRRVLRKLGLNALLWITDPDAENPTGTVRVLEDDLLRGYITRSTGQQHDIAGWRSICFQAAAWRGGNPDVDHPGETKPEEAAPVTPSEDSAQPANTTSPPVAAASANGKPAGPVSAMDYLAQNAANPNNPPPSLRRSWLSRLFGG